MDKLIEGARKLGVELSPQQLERFETYYCELASWNRRLNLTAITGYEEVQTGHFLDSLTVLPAIPGQGNGLRVIDVGSGAGLPGLPLKIVRPDIRLTLLEATAKKARFLAHIVAELGLEDVDINVGRAETVARESCYREGFDVAVSRAVSALPTLAELALPFCAVGGILIAQKKGDIEAEVAAAARAINVMGGRLREVRPVTLEEFGDRRYLVVIDKVGQTPPDYPRRPGIPAKRPVG